MPTLLRGALTDPRQLLDLMTGPSAFGPEREGIVVRWAEAFATEEHQQATGKLVRAGHVMTDQHWMHGEVPVNGLAS